MPAPKTAIAIGNGCGRRTPTLTSALTPGVPSAFMSTILQLPAGGLQVVAAGRCPSRVGGYGP
jgi:hypothetical protein